MDEKETTDLVAINTEINTQLANEGVKRALLATTFKGLAPTVMKQAIFEGMIRGFTFKQFLERDVYALPFASGYSIITSISNNRKIAMRTRTYAGKTIPTFEMSQDGKIVSCALTVKRIVQGIVCDFAALVYFDEYFKPGRPGKPSNWEKMPRTMIAKVAEMHALRMAFPEELSQTFIEEEMDREIATVQHSDERVREAIRQGGELSMSNFEVHEDGTQITTEQEEAFRADEASESIQVEEEGPREVSR